MYRFERRKTTTAQSLFDGEWENAAAKFESFNEKGQFRRSILDFEEGQKKNMDLSGERKRSQPAREKTQVESMISGRLIL